MYCQYTNNTLYVLLLLQVSKPLLKLQGRKGQRDIGDEARCGLLMRQVLLGAGHAGAQVGSAAAGAG